MIGLLPFFLAAFAWSPAAIPVRVEYDGAGKGGSDKKTSVSIIWMCEAGKECATAWETTYLHPNVQAWYLPGLGIHRIFLESGESRMRELSLIWKKPPSGLVGAAYSSVGGGDRELSFDWVEKPFSR